MTQDTIAQEIISKIKSHDTATLKEMLELTDEISIRVLIICELDERGES